MIRLMRWKRNQRVYLLSGLAALAVGVVLATEPGAIADSVTSTASATISQGAAITSSSQLIVSRPQSNLGFGAVAPIAQPATESAGTTAAQTPAASAERAAANARLAATAGLSRPAIFGVAGSPNQTFSISLPASVAYVSAGRTMTVTNIFHNAGQTPAVDGVGIGEFEIGADVSDNEDASSANEANDNSEQVIASVKSPFMPVIVSYN